METKSEIVNNIEDKKEVKKIDKTEFKIETKNKLEDNKDILKNKLNLNKSISNQDTYVHSKTNVELSKNLASQIPKMNENCRFSINLPAHKGKNVYKAIYEYSVKQKSLNGEVLDPSLYEINILLNKPSPSEEYDKETEDEINRFKTEHPNIVVNLIKHSFDFPLKNGKPKVKMGEVYKTIADLTIYRNLQRENHNNKANLIMRNGGADAKDKNKYFLSHIIDTFNKNSKIAIYKSESRYPRDILEKLPLLHFMYTLNSGFNRVFTKGKTNIGSGSYKANIYAEIGGFKPNLDMAEDRDLATRMRNYVKENDLILKKDLAKNAVDDPRRAIAALYNDKGVENQYAKFNNEEYDKIVRETDWFKKVLEEKIPDNVLFTKENLEKNLTGFYKTYLKYIFKNSSQIDSIRKSGGTKEELIKETYELTNKLIKKVLFAMGVNIKNYNFIKGETFDKSSFEITDFSVFDNLIKNRNFSLHDDLYE